MRERITVDVEHVGSGLRAVIVQSLVDGLTRNTEQQKPFDDLNRKALVVQIQRVFAFSSNVAPRPAARARSCPTPPGRGSSACSRGIPGTRRRRGPARRAPARAAPRRSRRAGRCAPMTTPRPRAAAAPLRPRSRRRAASPRAPRWTSFLVFLAYRVRGCRRKCPIRVSTSVGTPGDMRAGKPAGRPTDLAAAGSRSAPACSALRPRRPARPAP